MNKMDENKLHLGNFLMIVAQEQFFQKEHVPEGTKA